MARSACTTGPSPARMILTVAWGGSTSRLNGTPSATASAQSVSTLGFPVPDSSWDRVDLAIPAWRASSVSDSPVRARSRRSDAAIRATTSAAVSVPVCVKGSLHPSFCSV